MACSDTDNCSVTLILILFGTIRSNSSRAEAGTAYWERHKEMQSLQEWRWSFLLQPTGRKKEIEHEIVQFQFCL